MLKEFKGKTAFITGAAHGFGREYALEAARRGMKVVLYDIDKAKMLETEAELKALGAETLAIHGDVTVYDEIKAAVKKTVDTFKTIDLLINNAGVYFVGNFADIPVRDVEWMFATNVFSIFYTIHEVLPIMEAQGTDCHILNVASLAGLITAPTMSAYHGTKHAVVALSETLQQELAKKGSKVGVTIYGPGYVQTDLHHSWDYKPERFKADDPYYESETHKKNVARVEKFITTGQPITVTAPSAFECIEQGKFYNTFPEFDYMGIVNERHAKIAQRINPTDPLNQ